MRFSCLLGLTAGFVIAVTTGCRKTPPEPSLMQGKDADPASAPTEEQRYERARARVATMKAKLGALESKLALIPQSKPLDPAWREIIGQTDALLLEWNAMDRAYCPRDGSSAFLAWLAKEHAALMDPLLAFKDKAVSRLDTDNLKSSDRWNLVSSEIDPSWTHQVCDRYPW